MEIDDQIICFPGDRICASDESTIGGEGTYERGKYIHASLAGIVEKSNENNVSLMRKQVNKNMKFLVLF